MSNRLNTLIEANPIVTGTIAVILKSSSNLLQN